MVRGDGVAARSCAYLLGASGFHVVTERAQRTGLPALMVSGKTQGLMADVFRSDDLFVNLSRIETRVVAWGRDAEPMQFPHAAVIVSERDLLERLGPHAHNDTAVQPDWTILGSRPLPPSAVEHRFGSRNATVFEIELTKKAPPSTCWIESLDEGWLFLVPGDVDKGWLLAVGGTPQGLLAQSRLVSAQIGAVGGSAGSFSASPGMVDPFAGPRWLGCGSAALAFDPLCGDGTGNSIREAILAVAVIRAAESGACEEELREHYRVRLLSGFLRHLVLCRQFYSMGRSGPWWAAEIARIDEGIALCQTELRGAPPYRYRLEGYELCPV